jgi:hypothetical protein
MRHLEKFLGSIGQPAAGGGAGAGATFAVGARDNPGADGMAARVRAACGGAKVEVSPVFDSQDEQLSRFFYVRFPDATLTGSSADLWDLGYELEAALGAASVDVLRPPPADPAAADASSSSGSSRGEPGPATEPEWHLANIRAEEAWRMSRGAGILIGQPDTGVADHHLLTDSVARRHGCNMLERGNLPIDPLRRNDSTWNPGHGTSTASVAASRGNSADRRIRGVAPEAVVLPVRCVESVILADWSAGALPEAIRRAVDEGALVISMSLGGFVPFLAASIHAAIKYGAEKGVVFVAAAGNGLGSIGGPAVYPGHDFFCACIAGSTVADTGWSGSLGGPAVTVSAPAQGVWSAWREPGDNPETATRRVGPGSGTSYSTAIVGGIAAMWVAHHGHRNLLARFPAWFVTKAFQHVLRISARVPAGWNHGYYGAGIVDAPAVLQAPLPKSAAEGAGLAADDSPEAAERQVLRDRLAAGGVEPQVVARLDDTFLDRFGRELSLQLGLAEYRRAIAEAGATGQATGTAEAPMLSLTLRAALTELGAASVAAALV